MVAGPATGCKIVQHGSAPGIRVRVLLELGPVPPGSDEGFLNEVVSDLRLVHIGDSHLAKHRLHLTEKSLERRDGTGIVEAGLFHRGYVHSTSETHEEPEVRHNRPVTRKHRTPSTPLPTRT
jgi:hypothetical protein